MMRNRVITFFNQGKSKHPSHYKPSRRPVDISHYQPSSDFEDTSAQTSSIPSKLFRAIKRPFKRKEKSHRLKTEYQANITASLSLPLSDEEISDNENDESMLLESSKKLIVEHAARRVDLFFYTLVAYYNSQLAPVRARTFLQHGKGRNSFHEKNVTQACHSSFFGAFTDSNLEGDSILSNTHFLNSLNATIELPVFVNKLDDELENVCLCREKGLRILQNVAKGKEDPIDGVSHFLQMMNKSFSDIESKKQLPHSKIPYLNRDTEDSSRYTKQALVKLVKEATLAKRWDPKLKSVTDDYVALMLRLTEEEKKKAKDDKVYKSKCYIEKIGMIQREILEANVTSKRPKI